MGGRSFSAVPAVFHVEIELWCGDCNPLDSYCSEIQS